MCIKIPVLKSDLERCTRHNVHDSNGLFWLASPPSCFFTRVVRVLGSRHRGRDVTVPRFASRASEGFVLAPLFARYFPGREWNSVVERVSGVNLITCDRRGVLIIADGVRVIANILRYCQPASTLPPPPAISRLASQHKNMLYFVLSRRLFERNIMRAIEHGGYTPRIGELKYYYCSIPKVRVTSRLERPLQSREVVFAYLWSFSVIAGSVHPYVTTNVFIVPLFIRP